MYDVELYGFSINNLGFILFLRPKKPLGSLILPIFCGPFELNAICENWLSIQTRERKKNREELYYRPSSHLLLKNIIRQLNCKVKEVIIDKMEHKTLYATIYLDSLSLPPEKDLFNFREKNTEKKNAIITVDARPSDTIALSLYFDNPIFVSKKLFHLLAVELDEVKDLKTTNLIAEYFSNDTYFIDENKSDIFDVKFNPFLSEHSNFGDFRELNSVVQSDFKENSDYNRLSESDVGAYNESFSKSRDAIKKKTVLKQLKQNLLSKKDVLEKMLEVAIRREDYEQAAKIKLEIEKVKKINK